MTALGAAKAIIIPATISTKKKNCAQSLKRNSPAIIPSNSLFQKIHNIKAIKQPQLKMRIRLLSRQLYQYKVKWRQQLLLAAQKHKAFCFQNILWLRQEEALAALKILHK